MKKKIKTYRTLICLLVLVIGLSQTPWFYLMANSGVGDSMSIIQGETSPYGVKLHISSKEEVGSTIVMEIEGASVVKNATKNQEVIFDVTKNGTYHFYVQDAQGSILTKKEYQVDVLEDLYVKDAGDHAVTILSRDDKATSIEVSKGESKEIVALQKGNGDMFQASYTMRSNGTYWFKGIDASGKHTGSQKSYEESSYEVKKEDIVITSTTQLQEIIKDPKGSYVLGTDIIVEENEGVLLDTTFKGELNGNGHTIEGLEGPLFSALEGASIDNVHLVGTIESKSEVAGLALHSKNSTIQSVSYSGSIVTTSRAAGLVLQATDTLVQDSYVNVVIESKEGAGLVLEGNIEIKRSYVTGVIQGDSSYGIAKVAKIIDSYSAIGLQGSKKVYISEGETKNCFYDISLHTSRDDNNIGYTTSQITSGTLETEFYQEAGSYPRIQKSIYESYGDRAKELSNRSVLAIGGGENLRSIHSKLSLPKEMEWSSEGEVKVQGDKASIETSAYPSTGKQGILTASSKGIEKSFLVQGASVYSDNSVKVGKSLAASSTQVSFNVMHNASDVTDVTYYKVVAGSSTPKVPSSHQEAIETGWKAAYWSGVYNWEGLDWNREYSVYKTSLKSVEQIGSSVTTAKGKIGGTLSVEGSYVVGSTMVAKLSGNYTSIGYYVWQSSESRTGGFADIAGSKRPVTTNVLTDSYVVTENEVGKYLRVKFVSSDIDYTGEVVYTTEELLNTEISSVTIEVAKPVTVGKYTIEDKLTASMEPAKYKDEVIYQWYQEGVDTPIHIGANYTVQGEDVGHQIYVKAVAKEEGHLSGSKDSSLTSVVEPKTHPTLNQAPEVAMNGSKEKIEDRSITVKMPDTITGDSTRKGLYQFGYQELGGDIQEFPVVARGNSEVTITGLNPNTTYYIYAKRIGENGYLDSPSWPSKQFVEVSTDKEYVSGQIVLSEKNNSSPMEVYGNTIVAKIAGVSNPMQSGQYSFYYVNSDGSRGNLIKASAIGANSFELELNNINYIGKQVEVEFVGQGEFSGTITFRTEVIEKMSIHAPNNELKIKSGSTAKDTSVEVVLPKKDDDITTSEKFIIGYSNSLEGVPVEYREGGKVVEFSPSTDSDTTAILKNLSRDSEYYFYVRYSENETHIKSDWQGNDKALKVETDKTVLTGDIKMAYANVDGNPYQGDRLEARLSGVNSNFTYKGDWSWIRKESGIDTTLNNFFMIIDAKGNNIGTYYMIPEGEVEGVTYEVRFTPAGGFKNPKQKISEAVKKKVKEKYDTPDVPSIVTAKIEDTSSTIKQASGVGVYQFGYALSSNPTSITAYSLTAYSGVEVKVTGLDRNKEYVFYSRRVGDSVKETSDWSLASSKTSTKKTDISGYVEIASVPTSGMELEAKYVKASYQPAGDDSKGTWKWYRDGVVIAGVTNAKYTPTSDDVTKKLKAEYTGGGDFQGSVSYETVATKKAIPEDPKIQSIKEGTATSSGDLTIDAITNTNVYYRLQKATESIPNVPTTDKELTDNKWLESRTGAIKLTNEYKGEKLEPNASYILYVVKKETATVQVSNIISSSALKLGQKSQSGTITVSGDNVVTKSITAKLNSGNNTKGTWKWYRSKSDCGSGSTGMPSISDTSQWVVINSGYSPTVDSDNSTLLVSEDMWKYYIKAEFVANTDLGYVGTVRGAHSTFTKKIYEETLTLSTTSTDGNGKMAAYSGTVLTGTVNNYAESGTLDRATIQFKVGNTVLTPSGKSGNKFTYTMPNTAGYNGQTVIAEVSTPRNNRWYVDSSLKGLTAKTVSSKDSTNTSCIYKNGVPINNANDLENFMKATGNYTNRSASALYILTNNINMSSKGIIAYSETAFAGTLDGDYHTIAGTKNPIFHSINSEDATNLAVVKNIVFSNTTIDGYRQAILSSYAGNTKIENVLLIDAMVNDDNDSGMLVSWAGSDAQSGSVGNTIINQVGSAHGIFTQTTMGRSVGGLIAFLNGDGNMFSNNFSVNSVMNTTAGSAAGGLLRGSLSGVVSNMYNNYSTNQMLGLADIKAGISANILAFDTTKNNFFDTTIFNEDNSANVEGGLVIGKSTKDMVGIGLKSAFDTDSKGVWTYKDGFYPMLTWTVENNIEGAVLYAATRGAFTSMDGKTNSTNMFDGNIYGAIQVPTELQKNGYSYRSNNQNILKITDGGTIIPVGSVGQKAKITVSYSDPNTGATPSADFEFTIAGKISSWLDVKITGTTNPGKVLTATAGATSYQWIRRKRGSTTREVIGSATSQTYTIQPKDIGYELAVEAIYAGTKIASSYTAAVTSVAPSTAPTISNITDTTLQAKATGVAGANYEYAYASSASGTKNIMGQSTGDFTFTGLSRNTNYWIYARVAGGTGYEASGWSPVAQVQTKQTDTIGPLKSNDVVNMGDTLNVSVPDTNGQTGTWKLVRVKTNTPLTPTTSSDYGLTYTLTKDDVGSVIQVSYEASGNFKNPSSGALRISTATILRQRQTAPSTITEVESKKTDTSLTVKQVQTGETYDIGYRGNTSEPINIIATNVQPNVEVTIDSLLRNTNYLVYARKHEKSDYEPSPWSPAKQLTTDRTQVVGTVSQSGTLTANQTITFNAPNTNGQTGTWILERYNATNTVTINQSKYTVSNEGRTLSYTLKPEDASKDSEENKIRATYVGSGDFKGQLIKETGTIDRDNQSLPSDAKAVFSSRAEYSIAMEVTNGNDIYQFGYSVDGKTILPYEATVSVGITVTIDGLERDTTYQMYIRKAAKTGYYASEWQEVPVASEGFYTTKSTLTGNISYEEEVASGGEKSPSGNAAIGNTLKATYENGKYRSSDADDIDGTGSWQWYRDGAKIPGATSRSYTVEPTEGTPEIYVVYTANEDDGFTGSVKRSIGNVYKTPYGAPNAPEVQVQEENGIVGNALEIIHKEGTLDGLYYYIQLANDDTLPTLVPASEANTTGEIEPGIDNTGRWLKATKNMIVNLEANRSYVVYGARLETTSRGASGIVSARSVKTKRESVKTTQIEERTVDGKDVTWKVMQEKTLQVSLHGGQTGPTGTWRYYVTTQDPTATAKPSWQSVDGQLVNRKDGIDNEGKSAYSTITIPLKYADYYLKAEYSGNGDYSDTLELVTDKLQGQLLSGHARIISDNIDTSQVYNPIVVRYDGSDDETGYWRWYRQKDGVHPDSVDSSDYELIVKSDGKPIGTVGVEDSYMPTAKDIGKRIYAVYCANISSQYSGSVETEKAAPTDKLEQNKANSPTVLQVNGNDIQLSFPDNYKSPTEEIPAVILGYKEAKDNGDGTYSEQGTEADIVWQSGSEKGDIWLRNLKKNTAYSLYAKFEGTKAYQPSPVSEAVYARTGEQRFEESKLSYQTMSTISDGTTRLISDSGNTVTFRYSGKGYEEGQFSLQRSNGDIIEQSKLRIDRTFTGQVQCSYVLEASDIGVQIEAIFSAKDDALHYAGDIRLTTEYIVTKPPTIEKAELPILRQDLDTNLLIEVKDGYEYSLLKHTEDSVGDIAPDHDSGLWHKLKANTSRVIEGVDTSLYEFTRLERGATYYLHVRTAETMEYRASEARTSNGVTMPYIELSKVTLRNTIDEGNQPCVIETPKATTMEIEVPSTLKQGTVQITQLSMKRPVDNYEIEYPNTSIEEFQSKAIYERGSTWGNSHYGINIEVLDDSGTVISESKGNGTEIDITGGKTMRVTFYRVNAVSETGSYIFEAMLEDSESVTALLHSEVEVETQITQALPIGGVKLEVNGRYIRQSTNVAGIRNDSLMPMEYGVDKKVTKGESTLPELQGVLAVDPMQLGSEEVYLKMSGDGTNYTVEDGGVWLETKSTSKVEGLYRLGSRSRGAYAISGVCDPLTSWNWDKDSQRKNAYGIQVVVSIAKEDIEAYSKAQGANYIKYKSF